MKQWIDEPVGLGQTVHIDQCSLYPYMEQWSLDEPVGLGQLFHISNVPYIHGYKKQWSI